jgi:predicted amidohydrolase YtcJ
LFIMAEAGSKNQPRNVTIFVNGKIFTPSEIEGSASRDVGFSECMLVRNGILEHVGPSDASQVNEAKLSGASVQDLGGRFVLPGFVDGHMHLLLLGQSLNKLSLDHCKNLDDIRSAISQYGDANPEAERILCKGWMHSMTDGQALASMLDDLGDRPIFIDSKDLHSTWCNYAALKEMDADSLSDPPGGSISRDSEGKASGLLSEGAILSIIWPHLAKVASIRERIGAIKAAIEVYTKAGYTGMVELAMDESAWEALQLLRSEDSLGIRVAAFWVIKPSDTEEANLAQVERAIALKKQFNAESSPDLRITGIKVITDGVIDACTAALCEPYSSNGVSAEPLWTAEALTPVVRRADEAGLQCALHAIGDQAIKTALDVIEKYGTPGRRHRIEHLELTRPEDAKRLGQLGIIASIQAVHADPAILRAWPKLLGEHRCGRAFAYKEFLDGGATLALGTDAPTAPLAPLKNLYTATTRRSAREPELETAVNEHFALSLCDAVSAATYGAAYSCYADGFTGSLTAGKKADFVVVDMEWAAERLLKAEVSQTWFEGNKVFDISN